MSARGDFADFFPMFGSVFAGNGNYSGSKVDLFTTPTFAPGGAIQACTWTKPKSISMVLIYLSGSGAGGGGGRNTPSLTGGGGGGGGGSASLVKLLMPAILLPDRLFIYLPSGGTAGAAQTAGGNGYSSTISCGLSISKDLLLTSGSTGATGGGGATSTTSGTAGNGEVITSSRFARSGPGFLEQWTGLPGLAGASASSTGTNQTIFPGSGGSLGSIQHGGLGGGSVTTSDTTLRGGLYTAVAGAITSDDRPIHAQAAGESGSGTPYPFSTHMGFNFWGGLGGAGNGAGTGGTGGNGAFGCGGGGGGAGVTTGGPGGRGGDGWCLIISW